MQGTAIHQCNLLIAQLLFLMAELQSGPAQFYYYCYYFENLQSPATSLKAGHWKAASTTMICVTAASMLQMQIAL